MRLFAAVLCALMTCALVSGAPDPASTDDAVNMVLSVDENGTQSAWDLDYGQARQKALEYLKAGHKERALSAAKMQYLLCPLESTSVDLAIGSVRQMLVAVDRDDTRAKEFERYVRFGPAGPDAKAGTADDGVDPIESVALDDFARPREYYQDYDRVIDDHAAVSATWEKAWYETQKAYERLNGGDFDAAAVILVTVLSDQVNLPFAPAGGDGWDLQKIQNVIDRVQAGLGVVYRSRTGTVAGVDEFIRACMDYARYGPAGKDDLMGTADDLKPPM